MKNQLIIFSPSICTITINNTTIEEIINLVNNLKIQLIKIKIS